MIKFCLASGIISNKLENIFNLLYFESGSLSNTAKLCWSKSLSSIIFELFEKFCKFNMISFANLSLPFEEYS